MRVLAYLRASRQRGLCAGRPRGKHGRPIYATDTLHWRNAGAQPRASAVIPCSEKKKSADGVGSLSGTGGIQQNSTNIPRTPCELFNTACESHRGARFPRRPIVGNGDRQMENGTERSPMQP
jgi:hypothetical protein